jgi:hypothetical protein
MLGLLAVIGTSVWGTSRALEDPALIPPRPTAEDAAHAQQKLVRLIRGSATEPIVMSEAELNAFISRNLDARDLPFDRPIVFLRDGNAVDILGQVPLGRLLAESPFGAAAELVPRRWTSRPVWLQMRAHAQFESGPRRQLRLDVRRFAVGQQQVPALALRVMLDPARLRFLRMPLPDTVADVRIQTGRIVIRPTSSRERT